MGYLLENGMVRPSGWDDYVEYGAEINQGVIETSVVNKKDIEIMFKNILKAHGR